MRKLFMLFIAALGLVGCKDSNDLVFDKTSEERLTQSMTEVKTALLSSPNGWVASLPTFAGGGYGFYMAFDASENVKMFGDLNNTSLTTVGSSTYRLKAVLGTELIFDTFNYISLLADPVPSVFGGAAGSGYKSDLEFIFKRSNGDSLVFIGKKYNQPLVMVKATAAQKASYEAGGLKTAVDKFNKFFSDIKNPYIEIAAGAATLKAGIGVNTSNNLTNGKRISLTGVLADGKSTASGTAKYSSKLNGADLLGTGLIYNGLTFLRVDWKDATTLAFYDQAGKEYIIKSNPTPLTPFDLLFGFPTAFPYKTMTIVEAGLPSGVNSGFNAIYNQMRTNFGTVRVVSTILTLTSNSQLKVDVNYFSTAAFVATATYNYTKNGNIITLSDPVYSANWNTRATALKPLTDFMLTGPFRLDWVTSTDPTNVSLMGGFYRVADANSFFYGTL